MKPDNIRPGHYNLPGLNIEARDVMLSILGEEGLKAFYHANVIKYILRSKNKNGLEDLKKARTYLDWLIELGESK